MSVDTLQLWFTFTKDSGDNPATGLDLSEIKLYLTQVHRLTGARTIVWNGDREPDEEIENLGTYFKIYSTANLDLYHYAARGKYIGAVDIDSNWVVANIEARIPFATIDTSCWFY